jgi:hypothetical protein
MVPWPHMPRYPTLLKNTTDASEPASRGGSSNGADDDIIAARLADGGTAVAVMAVAQLLHHLRQRQLAQFGKPGHDHARRLAAGVRIDADDFLHRAIVPAPRRQG